MTTRDEILRRWQEGLEVNQSPAGQGLSQITWLHRLYVHVYQFLLSCYGHGQWRTQPQDEASPVELIAPPDSEISGRSAKSVGQISQVLKMVHVANAETAALRDSQPRGAEVQKTDWIVAAEFHYRPQSMLFHRLLLRCGILSREFRLGKHFFVEVRRCDFDRAFSVFQHNSERLSLKAHHAKGRAERISRCWGAEYFGWFVLYFLVASSASAIVSSWVVRTCESLLTDAFAPFAYPLVMIAGLIVALVVWVRLSKWLHGNCTTG